MLLVWGMKESRRKLGWAADFCPICRGLGPVHVTQKRRVAHLYWVPLGRSSAIGHELVCGGCGRQDIVGEVPYEDYVRDRAMDLVDMAVRTTPTIAEMWGERLELEDRLATGTLSKAERAALIAEPFRALGGMTHNKVKAGQIPTGAGLAIIGLVFLVPVTIAVWAQARPNVSARAVLGGILVVLVAAGLHSFRNGGTRWVRRTIHPMLVRALSPLRPTREELAAALDRLRGAKSPLASRVQLDWLVDDLSAAEAGVNAASAGSRR